MNKVTIDRELLERCRARLYGMMQADLSTELAALLADHAEQHLEMVEQSVEVVAYRVSLPSEPELGHWFDEHAEEEPQTCWYEPLMTVAQHQRILAASVPAVADCDDSGSVTLTTEAAQIIAQCIGAHAYVMGALQNGRPDLALAESAKWVEGFSHASLLASAEGVKDE